MEDLESFKQLQADYREMIVQNDKRRAEIKQEIRMLKLKMAAYTVAFIFQIYAIYWLWAH